MSDVRVFARRYGPDTSTILQLVKGVAQAQSDHGLRRDLPEIFDEFASVDTAQAALSNANPTEPSRFVIYEQVVSDDPVARGVITFDSDFYRHPGMEPNIRASGVDPRSLGLNACYWVAPRDMLASTTPLRTARLAVGMAQFFDYGPPWIILNEASDDPSREFPEAGLRPVAGNMAGWLPEYGLDGNHYALHVARNGLRVATRQVKGSYEVTN